MTFFVIRANGRYYDEVYYSSFRTIADVKKEYQALLKTQNVLVSKVRR